MIKNNVLQNAIWVSKNADFYAYFESVKNAKTHAKKVISKKCQKNGVLYLNYCVQKFSAYNFFCVNLFVQTQHRILHLLYP
jgi:hypothetical protein